MKTVSIVVPTYNEEENVYPLACEIIKEFSENIPDYEYELLFIDNNSQDNTRNIIRELCKGNPRIKAIILCRFSGSY